jgi:hypothetical protein
MAEDPDHNRSKRPRPVNTRRYETDLSNRTNASMPFGVLQTVGDADDRSVRSGAPG